MKRRLLLVPCVVLALLCVVAGVTVWTMLATNHETHPNQATGQPHVSIDQPEKLEDNQSHESHNTQPEPSQQDPGSEPGHGMGYPPLPDGWTLEDAHEFVDDAASIAATYWRAKVSVNAQDPDGWLQETAPYATPAQQARDQAWWADNSTDKAWLIQQDAHCHGETWSGQVIIHAWTDQSMTIGIPARQWCTYRAQSADEAAMEKRRMAVSSGFGGYRVTIVSFDMIRSGDSWLVDQQDRIQVTPNP